MRYRFRAGAGDDDIVDIDPHRHAVPSLAFVQYAYIVGIGGEVNGG